MSSALRAVVGGVVVTAIGASALVLHELAPGGLAALAVFPVLAVLAEVVGADVFGSSTVSLSAVPILAAACAGDPRASLAAALAAGIATTVRAGSRRVSQLLFNPAALVISAAVACLVMAPGVGRGLPVLAALGVVAGVLYFAVDNGLVGLAIGLDQRRPVLEVVRNELSWLLPSFTAYGLLAALLGFTFVSNAGWGVLAIVLPPAFLRHSQRQYVRKTSRSTHAVRDANRRLREAHTLALAQHRATASALAQAIEARDSGTGGHVQRVTALAVEILAVVDPLLAADEEISFGFLLHDVGKIGVPDAILRKPGPLTREEREVMDKHPQIGHDIVSRAGFSPVVAEIVLTHHERWDGLGYPNRLRATEIPLATRVFCVADSLDAMTDDRVYRPGMPLEEALAEIVRHSGTQFEPAAVAALFTLDREVIVELLQLDRNRVIELV